MARYLGDECYDLTCTIRKSFCIANDSDVEAASGNRAWRISGRCAGPFLPPGVAPTAASPGASQSLKRGLLIAAKSRVDTSVGPFGELFMSAPVK